eukprot:scaffold8377_cov139-Skeletonema_menzelii.AAC.4
MSNIDEARAQLEEGLFDTDTDSDNDSQNPPSDEDSDEDTSSFVNFKPALKKGDKVVAAWWDLESGERVNSEGGRWFSGKVQAVKERDHYSGSRASKYGPIRVYDIHYDDGDKLKGVLDVFVCPEKDHDLDSKNWKGVRNVRDKSSSDCYAKEIGWYVATIGGEEKSFSTLYEAMKKSDEYTIKVKKENVRKSDLNLPDEWELPKTKKRGRSMKVDNEDGNPVKKKKKKPNMNDIFDDTGSETDDAVDNVSESIVPDQGGSLPGGGEPKYIGVCKQPKQTGMYRSLFYQKDNTQKSAGIYKLRADAAHARDECCRERVGLVRDGNGPNFSTIEEYKTARAREITARGLSLKDVGTLSEITAKIQKKRNDFRDGKQESNDAHEEESEDESEVESLASDQDTDAESDVDSKLSVDGEETKYIDVNYIQCTDRYRGELLHNKERHLAGNFILKADAAHARDELGRTMGATRKGFNFKTEKEYKHARAKEIKRRGLNLDETGTVTDIFKRIETKRTKWNEIKGRNVDTDNSSLSSTDDLPLISMKTKRRRLTSPKETVTNSSSDYRGVTHNQKEGKRWTVSIFYNDEDRFVGKYDLESDAARVYDEVSAILVCNYDPNFANKSDHEEARKREAETLGLNVESIDTFQASMEKANIYVNKLLSGAVHDSERILRKTRSSSPFTPILSDCDIESNVSSVDNVNDSNKKIADLNEAMTMKWGRRLPSAGNQFIDSYQQNLCEMLGGFVDESSKTPIGTFVSVSSLQLADDQEENDEDLDGGESTDVSQRNTGMKSSFNFGDKLSDDRVTTCNKEGIVENQCSFEQHENLVEATHDNQDEKLLEKKKPDDSHEHVAAPANHDEGIEERKNGSQGDKKVDLSNDDKKKGVKYVGVTNLKGSNRFRGNVWFKNKQKSVGDYVLKADAAHARDEFCRSFNINRPPNFNTQEEYLHARADEIAQRGLTLDAADSSVKKREVLSLSEVAARLQVKKAEWDAESKKSKSDTPILSEKKSHAEQTTQDDDSGDDISLFSDANDEQDNFAPSQDSAAVTVAISNVTDFSEMKLAAVTKEQEEILEFPIGCPVLWKLQDGSLHKGKVAAAWLNMKGSINLVYEVHPLDKKSKQMKCASELTFDTHCPVYIKSSPTDSDTVVEGEVLLSRTDDTKTLYTILLLKEGNEFQLKHDVPFDLLRFRKVAKENSVSSQRVTENSESNSKVSLHSEQKSETKTNSAKEVQPKQLNFPEKEGSGHCDMSISTSNSTISTRDSGRMSTPRGRSGNRNTIWDGRSIDIELPDWFVSDNRVKDHLCCE